MAIPEKQVILTLRHQVAQQTQSFSTKILSFIDDDMHETCAQFTTLGCTLETLRSWVRHDEREAGWYEVATMSECERKQN